MNRITFHLLAAFFALSSGSGCGGATSNATSSSTCPVGAERCDCYPNATCNAGLECRSNRCVTAAGGGSTGGTSSSAGAFHTGGTATNLGTSGYGGTPSSGGAVLAGGSPGSGGVAGAGGTVSHAGSSPVAGGSSCVGTVCYVVVNPVSYCGDGTIDAANGETCDDGNRIGGDGCSGICKLEPNWLCTTPGQPCTSLIVCGNGTRQTGEGCDDGNTKPGDGCSSTCTVEPGWYCSGSDSNDPTSKSACQKLASCGDGRIATGEQCDLGSANGTGVGCNANCQTQSGWVCRPLPTGCVQLSVCGNGTLESGETCDDGNTVSGDGCSMTCKVEASYYDCSTPGSLCKDMARCGNGALEGPEQCDDGNIVSSDGCSSNCQVEAGWQCRQAGKACIPLCGDGVIKGGEQCDDKNTVSGDGCTSVCMVECGFNCTGSPSNVRCDREHHAHRLCPDVRRWRRHRG